MEWIYTWTKVRGRGSLELALKEVKQDWQFALFCNFKNCWFNHTWLFPLMYQGLIDRYSGVDMLVENLICSELFTFYTTCTYNGKYDHFTYYSPCPNLEGTKDALFYKFRRPTIGQICSAMCTNKGSHRDAFLNEWHKAPRVLRDLLSRPVSLERSERQGLFFVASSSSCYWPASRGVIYEVILSLCCCYDSLYVWRIQTIPTMIGYYVYLICMTSI